MGQHSDRVRAQLMDAAEELFALHGIDAVSNRQIAERAGNANHSAIAYHFGSRDDLIRALMARHNAPMTERRRELLDELSAEPTVYDIVRCRLLPFIEVLDSLPRPSYRAQFLIQLRSVPSADAIIRDSVESQALTRDIEAMFDRVDTVSRNVLRARSGIVGHLVLGVAADFEARRNAGDEQGDWLDVGYFLIDAASGMLSAPVTRPTDVSGFTENPRLV
ncbi:helix-turn-helix domain-containing protein [Microbacterium sp. KR10-403]|uniref:TetR/AcrR family transcriptional regulator n=1 Tax=Microbacterium sp. KR10-403 TaxID=3158581 RepID=UPI0032E4DB73